MASLIDVFKKLGSVLGRVGKFLARFVSDAQVDIAIDIVEEAANRFLDNAQRREFAVAEIQARLHVPESIARWLVETAVIAVKAKVADALEKLEEEAKKANDPKVG